jgi:hypothetical protein
MTQDLQKQQQMLVQKQREMLEAEN